MWPKSVEHCNIDRWIETYDGGLKVRKTKKVVGRRRDKNFKKSITVSWGQTYFRKVAL